MKMIALKEKALPADCFVFKHSTTCPVSARALTEVESAAVRVPVYRIDIREQRDLSNWVEAEYRVRHESPQLILIREKKARKIWNHGQIRREDIRE
jgi:bacillithiol system protein YtxJ